MSIHIPAREIEQQAQIVTAPLKRNRGERVFDLHPAVHFALLGLYLAFAGILMTAFMGEHLIVPAVIIIVGILSLFVTPGLWARVAGDDLRKRSFAEFLQEGVDCITGRLTAGQALAQIMVLPALMVGLALVFAVIKASL
jgi:Flp pilus assembly protein TadB